MVVLLHRCHETNQIACDEFFANFCRWNHSDSLSSPAPTWNVTIDWTVRENVRAQLRVIVKRILRKHGYPPDKQEKATQNRRKCCAGK